MTIKRIHLRWMQWDEHHSLHSLNRATLTNLVLRFVASSVCSPTLPICFARAFRVVRVQLQFLLLSSTSTSLLLPLLAPTCSTNVTNAVLPFPSLHACTHTPMGSSEHIHNNTSKSSSTAQCANCTAKGAAIADANTNIVTNLGAGGALIVSPSNPVSLAYGEATFKFYFENSRVLIGCPLPMIGAEHPPVSCGDYALLLAMLLTAEGNFDDVVYVKVDARPNSTLQPTEQQ